MNLIKETKKRLLDARDQLENVTRDDEMSQLMREVFTEDVRYFEAVLAFLNSVK